MILPLLLAVVAFAALLPIVLPLLRGARGTVERGQYDRAVYRDQLRELDRDIARGLVTADEVQATRLEIQRRLLAADARPERGIRGAASPVLAAVVAVGVAGGAVGLYSLLGAPGLPAESAAERRLANAPQSDAEHVNMQTAAATLAEKLRADPNNRDGWLLYARTTAMLRAWEEAAKAYHKAIDLGATAPDVYAGYGEMLVMQAQGIIGPPAHEAFATALKADPKNEVARYYLAMAAGQAGDAAGAIAGFRTLLGDIPEDSPMRPEIIRRIAEAAKAANLPMPEMPKGTASEAAPAPAGPDAAAMAAAANMSPEQRKAMIEGMVGKLADRMQANPNDLDGWMRLGRAYAVLGERDKAADAYEHAARLKPDEPAIPLQAVEALLEGLKPSDPLPPRAVTLLHQVEATSPDQPEVLWYLGVVAARDAHPDAARRYWTRLLHKLPAGGEDARMVQTALDALKGE